MSQMQRDHAQHEFEERLRANFAEIARGVHFEVPPTLVRAQPMERAPRIVGRRRFAFAGAVVAGCAVLVVGVLATRHGTTTPSHAPLTHASVSTPSPTSGQGSRFEQLPAARPITTMPTTAPGESRDAALLRLGYAPGTPVLPVSNGSGQVVGYVKTSYLVGPLGDGAYPTGKPGYPITGLDGYTLYGWYTRDLGALPRSIAEYPARLALVRSCVGNTSASVEHTPTCVQAVKDYKKPFGAAVLRAQRNDGEPIADHNGKIAGFIPNLENEIQHFEIAPTRNGHGPGSLWPTDLGATPIQDRQIYIVVNQDGEVVGYIANSVGFVPSSSAVKPGFDIEAYRAEQHGDCVDHGASAAAARRFPYCPSTPQMPNFATNAPSKLTHTKWTLDSITDHGVHHDGPATLTFGDGAVTWATCNDGSGDVHVAAGLMFVTRVSTTRVGCLADTYLNGVLHYGHNEANSWYIDTAGKLHLIDPTNRVILVFHRS
ncbi:MAG TPA: META domain-containing protein [Acidimicrobiia bacterium]|jgi:hypothetical protein